MLKPLRTHPARKWVVGTATIGNITIFVVDITIWASYRAMTSSHHMLLFILVNVVVSIPGEC